MTAKPILTGILVDAPADAKAIVTWYRWFGSIGDRRSRLGC